MLKKFCDTLFGKVTGKQILLWAKHDDISRSYFFDNATELKHGIQSYARVNDVYVGTGLLDKRPEKEGGRGTFNEVTGAVALHLDIDFGDEGHKRPDLPMNEAEALQIIDEAFPDMPPTMIVHTGNGIHVYYVYNEPIYFTNEEEKQKIATLLRSFQNTVLAVAQNHGWGMDITSDLTRVLRPPETWNFKGGEAKPVVLLQHNDCYYSPEDFNGKLMEVPVKITKDLEQYNAIKVPLTYVEPPEKFAILLANDLTVNQYINCTHPGPTDRSSSAMDMGLANLMARAEFTPQEMVDSLIAVAKLRNTKVKGRSYYLHTIATAEGNKSLPFVAPVITDKKQVELKDFIANKLNIKVEYLLQVSKEDPFYHLKLEGYDEVITLPNVQCLTTCKQFRERVGSIIQCFIPSMKQDQWDSIYAALLSLVTVMPTDAVKDIALDFLTKYLRTAQIQTPDNRVLAMESNYPYILDDEYFTIDAEEFRQFINNTTQERLPKKQIISYLPCLVLNVILFHIMVVMA